MTTDAVTVPATSSSERGAVVLMPTLPDPASTKTPSPLAEYRLMGPALFCSIAALQPPAADDAYGPLNWKTRRSVVPFTPIVWRTHAVVEVEAIGKWSYPLPLYYFFQEIANAPRGPAGAVLGAQACRSAGAGKTRAAAANAGSNPICGMLQKKQVGQPSARLRALAL